MEEEQLENSINSDFINDPEDAPRSKKGATIHSRVSNDVLSRNQIIHMPFLEDVLNEDEEKLKRISR